MVYYIRFNTCSPVDFTMRKNGLFIANIHTNNPVRQNKVSSLRSDLDKLRKKEEVN